MHGNARKLSIKMLHSFSLIYGIDYILATAGGAVHTVEPSRRNQSNCSA